METPTEPTEPADPRRIAACLNACRGIKTEMLELPGARAMPILGIKEGDKEGLCLLVERSTYDALVDNAEKGAQYRRWFEELSSAIIEHLDPKDEIVGGLIAKIKRAARQIEEDAHLRGVMEQIAAMTENAKGGSLAFRIHDLATDAALDSISGAESAHA